MRSTRILVCGAEGRSSVSALLAHAFSHIEGKDVVVHEDRHGHLYSLLYDRFVFRPDVVVVPNASDSRAETMAVPAGKRFYTSDLRFLGGSNADLVAKGRTLKERLLAVSMKVLEDLEVLTAEIRASLESFAEELFPQGPFRVGKRTVINACEAHMASDVLAKLPSEDMDDVTVVLNCEYCGEDRFRVLCNMFTDLNCPKVIVIGSGASHFAGHMADNVLGSRVVHGREDPNQVLGQCDGTVVCMGSCEGSMRNFLTCAGASFQ